MCDCGLLSQFENPVADLNRIINGGANMEVMEVWRNSLPATGVWRYGGIGGMGEIRCIYRGGFFNYELSQLRFNYSRTTNFELFNISKVYKARYITTNFELETSNYSPLLNYELRTPNRYLPRASGISLLNRQLATLLNEVNAPIYAPPAFLRDRGVNISSKVSPQSIIRKNTCHSGGAQRFSRRISPLLN